MRRSHYLLAGAVVVAGAAALLGNRTATPALVRGAPIDRDPGVGGEPGSAADPGHAGPGHMPGAASAAAIADLIDLDHRELAADGAHYEALLKDGRRAVLTLDPVLQSLAEKLLSEARAPRGAIVAMAPDGRILALAGRRSEPAAKGSAEADWHLATDVWAPAASVFKLVTASALVAAGVDPSDKVCFHGGLRSVQESNLRDDKRDSRCESLTYGVAHSNNAILGKLAFQKLAPAELTRFAHELGVAESLPGAELHGIAGAIDIPAAHDLSFAQTAAGFSGSKLSAVGGALLAATFADDGEQPVPWLVTSIDGVAVPPPGKRRAVTSEIARAVGRMMQATCEFGSASRSFGRHQAVRVAGKTGTLTRTEPFYMEHSWFVGYAPAEQPEIIVSVVLGNPENWHLRGHEAARRLIDRFLDHADRHGAPRPGHAREKARTGKTASTRRVGW
ncbi:MAG TPA: penicillin-binding transpeptidase domain-containing protein [Kofleriaceae bacterium]|jgi:cell division protein FtsI/penicillin-binding protein 2|nr:penicillin-binding transpeptidase domain-containing protein [Kofleriaceae bacterium]